MDTYSKTYRLIERIIERGVADIASLEIKLNTFYALDEISKEEYELLIELLAGLK